MNLPKYIIMEIFSNLHLRDIRAFAVTCKTYFKLYFEYIEVKYIVQTKNCLTLNSKLENIDFYVNLLMKCKKVDEFTRIVKKYKLFDNSEYLIFAITYNICDLVSLMLEHITIFDYRVRSIEMLKICEKKINYKYLFRKNYMNMTIPMYQYIIDNNLYMPENIIYPYKTIEIRDFLEENHFDTGYFIPSSKLIFNKLKPKQYFYKCVYIGWLKGMTYTKPKNLNYNLIEFKYNKRRTLKHFNVLFPDHIGFIYHQALKCGIYDFPIPNISLANYLYKIYTNKLFYINSIKNLNHYNSYIFFEAFQDNLQADNMIELRDRISYHHFKISVPKKHLKLKYYDFYETLYNNRMFEGHKFKKYIIKLDNVEIFKKHSDNITINICLLIKYKAYNIFKTMDKLFLRTEHKLIYKTCDINFIKHIYEPEDTKAFIIPDNPDWMWFWMRGFQVKSHFHIL